MDIDEALRTVGGFRRYHLTLFALLCFSSFIPTVFHGISYVFIGWTPPHHCAVPANQSKDDVIPRNSDGTYSSCQIYVNKSVNNDTKDCTSWSYDSNGYETMVTEFDLVCDRMHLAELSQTLQMAGTIVADTICSYFTDKYGRKRIHIAVLYMTSIFGLGVTFSPTFVSMAVFRILVGATCIVAINSGLTLMMELFDSDRRAFAGICLEFGWLAVYFLPLPLAYLAQDWRVFQLVGSLLPLVFTVYYCILPESPGWLVAYQRYDEAEDVLDRMARYNGVDVPPITITQATDDDDGPDVQMTLLEQKPHLRNSHLESVESLAESERLKNGSRRSIGPPRSRSNTGTGGRDQSKTKTLIRTITSQISLAHKTTKTTVPVLQLIRDPKLRRHLALANLFWFANSIVYYGLILNASNYGNRFLLYLLMGVAEAPAYVVSMLVVDRFGRRLPMALFFLLAGVTLSVTILVPKDTDTGEVSLLCLVLTGRFAISGSFAIMVLYLRELFPTDVRSSSVAWSSVGGGIGNLSAPVTAYISKLLPWLPNIIFGGVSLVAAAGVIPLPETANKPLPLTVEELYEIYYKKKRKRANTTTSMR